MRERTEHRPWGTDPPPARAAATAPARWSCGGGGGVNQRSIPTPKHPFHPLSRQSLPPNRAPQPGDGASSLTRRPLPPPASSSCPAAEDEGIAQTLKRSASRKSTRWTSFARRNPPRPKKGARRRATPALEHALPPASPTAPAFPKRASIPPPTAHRKLTTPKVTF